MVKDGWKSVGKLFVLALILDVIYQFIATAFVYPGERSSPPCGWRSCPT
jgi:hypothetical protein